MKRPAAAPAACPDFNFKKPAAAKAKAAEPAPAPAPYAGVGTRAWLRKQEWYFNDDLSFYTPGFQKISEWPQYICKRIFGVGSAMWDNLSYKSRLDRYTNLHENGMIIHSFYSGYMTEVAMMRAVATTLHASGHGKPADDTVIFWSACDNDRSCQTLGLESPKGQENYIPSLQSLLPAYALDDIAKMRPTKDLTDEAKSICYDDIRRYILKNKKKFFQRGARVPRLPRLHEESDPVEKMFCNLAWTDCLEEDDPRRTMTSTWAGFCCQPYAPAGKRNTTAHEAMEPYAIFQGYDQVVRTDFLHLDNSHLFDPDLCKEDFPGRWFRYIKLSPHDLGT